MGTSRFLRAASAAVAAASLLLNSGSSRASTVVALTQQELVQQAHTILHGTCVGKRSLWNDDRSAILTEYTFEAKEVLKGGDPQSPATVTFRQWGGQVGDRGYFISGAAKFGLGEEVVAFLAPPSGPSQCAFTVGLSQGKWKVEDDPVAREKVLRRDLSGLRILSPATRMFIPPTALEAARPPLKPFLEAVREQLRKQ